MNNIWVIKIKSEKCGFTNSDTIKNSMVCKICPRHRERDP